MSIVEIGYAKNVLEGGGVVGVPTETVYGLAALIDDAAALKQVFELKARPLFDPLIVHIADISALSAVTLAPPIVARILAERFWPGPLTLVLRKHSTVNELITAGLDTVGVRVPAHPVAQQLLRNLRAPFAAPSANRFKRTSPTTAAHVLAEFPQVDLPVLDGGACEVGIESTVVQVLSDAEVTILRPGVITRSMIEEELRKHGLSPAITTSESGASPGALIEHYMPAIPLVILPQRMTELSPDEREQLHRRHGGATVELVLALSPLIAARVLYSQMRELSNSGASWMYVVRTPEQTGEVWEAVWNRLYKAAGSPNPLK